MICLVAISRPEYGRLAVNAVASLRAFGYDGPITVVTDGVFQATRGSEALNVETISSGGERNPFRLKLRLREMFESFVYLDADTVAITDPTEAIEWLGSQRFYAQTIPDSKAWAAPEDIASHYGVESIPVLNSSIIASGDGMKRFWSTALKAYDKPCRTNELLGGLFPDEVTIGVASAKQDIMPESRELCYFKWSTRKWTEFPFMSLAGGGQPMEVIRAYNAAVTRNAKALGITPYLYSNQIKRWMK